MKKLLYISIIFLSSCMTNCPDCDDLATVEIRYSNIHTSTFLIKPGEKRIIDVNCDSVLYDTILISHYADSVLDLTFARNIELNKKEIYLKKYHDSCTQVDYAYWEYNENKYQELFLKLNWRDSIFNDMFINYLGFVDSLKGAYAWVNGYTIIKQDSGKFYLFDPNDRPVVFKSNYKQP